MPYSTGPSDSRPRSSGLPDSRSRSEMTQAGSSSPTRSDDARLPHLVIVGNGMAAHRLIETLAAKSNAPRHITVIGAEPHAAYNRILLSSWLAGDVEQDGLTLTPPHDSAVTVDQRLGARVERIDRTRRLVECDDGEVIPYDHLVLALGSRSAMPQIPGITLTGVSGFRDLDDAARLADAAKAGGAAVVVGGGLLGLEAAAGLAARGMQVCVLQRSPRLMNRQLDATASTMLASEIEGRGIHLETGARLAEIVGDENGQVAGVRLEDDERLLPANCVVIAAGITPNAELGRDAGLDCDRAIVVDDTLATSDPDISALGECCQFEDTTYGLVEPIWHQVEVLARRLCGEPSAPYHERACATKLKVSGVSLYAFGPTEAEDGHEVLSYRDQGEYRRLLLRDGRLEGAVLYGDTRMGPWLFRLAEQGLRLDQVRHSLLLGQADTEALLADDATTDTDPSTTEQDAA